MKIRSFITIWNTFPRLVALAFGLAMAMVLAGGILFYSNAHQHAWHDAEAELRAIAQFKTDQLIQWRAGRIADASVIMDSAYLNEGVVAWMETKNLKETEKLLNRLRSTAEYYQYRDILLVDAKGQVLLSVTGHTDPLHQKAQQAVDTALHERRALLSDLHTGDGEEPIHLGVIAPIFAGGIKSGLPLGAIILQCDAKHYLYPLIQSWPVPSASGETVFFQRDGDDVLFLSPLRFQKDAALNLRIPLARTEVPAVMAVLGKSGIMEGPDYRGVRVLSFLLAVPDSPWFLVVKQDTAEVFAPLRQQAIATAVVVGLLILGLALAFSFDWYQRTAVQEIHRLNESLEQHVRERTEELRQSEEQLRATYEQAAVGIAHVGLDGSWLRVNQRLCEIVGYSEKELLALTFQDITHPDDLDSDLNYGEQLLAGERQTYSKEKRYIRKDRSHVWINLSVSLVRAAAGAPAHFISVIQDISERKRTEEELNKKHLLLENLARQVPGVVYQFCLSPDGQSAFPYSSPGMMDIYEVTPEEVREDATPVYGRLHPDDHDRVVANIQESAMTLQTFYCEFRVILPRQGLRWRWSQAQPERTADGGTLWHGIISDITERKQTEQALHESEEQFRTLANAIPQLVWIANAAGFIYWYNERWYQYTGTTPQQMEGWGWQSVHDPKMLPNVMEKWTGSITSGQPFDMEFPLLGADGQFHSFLTRIQPLLNSSGQVVKWFGTNTDIEPLKQAQVALSKLNTELEQRVQARTTELEAVNHELEAFSYSVSHDLKAPLRSVDGFAKMLEEDYADRLDDEGRRLLKVVRDSARDMGQLITDLLKFSRLNRKDLTVERLNLRRIAEDACRQVELDAEGRTIRWEIGDLPPAFGDVATIREVMLNLFANAVKFTRPRKEAVIGFSGHEETGEMVYSVTDNGVGFEMAYKDKLFSVFQRLHTSAEFEGTGIGLALVQRIIQRHGGRVWAEGEVDKGARVFFTLPRGDGRNDRLVLTQQ